jgi:adenosine deaminase
MTDDRAAAVTPPPGALRPLVVLHEHLDGGLRPPTLLALLRRRGLPTPADDAEGLAQWFAARAQAGSLTEYLKGFALTVPAMADVAALEQVAFEAAEDARDDGAVLAEFRIAPLLFEPLGVDPDEAVAAMLRGLARCGELDSGLILCALRHEPPPQAERVADLALRWMGRGVVGFDIAGAERGFPPGLFAAALQRVREAGLPITVHAGEADAGERVLEAARLGARRIGHGVRLADLIAGPRRDAVLDEVIGRGLHLEICPTSNVQTGAAASIAGHPVVALWRAGVSLSIHCDNRLVSCTRPSAEFDALRRHTALTDVDLLAMTLEAAEHSFLGEAARARAAAAVHAAAAARGLGAAVHAAVGHRPRR